MGWSTAHRTTCHQHAYSNNAQQNSISRGRLPRCIKTPYTAKPNQTTHVGDLSPDSDLPKVCQLIQQQATAGTSHHQQACDGHWAKLLAWLPGVPQLNVTSLNKLLEALLTTSKATGGSG
jgi:hypothetical protein